MLENIASKFNIKGNVLSIEKYGCGHINQTYLVITSEEKYILQKINSHIFKDVKGLMNNISLVLDFQKQIIKENNGDPTREAMTLVSTKEGNSYYYNQEDDGYYRVYLFVPRSLAIQNASNKEEFAESGYAFGKFQSQLEKFDASRLVEVIKDFHNTKSRYDHFINVLNKDEYDRKKNALTEINFVLARKNDTESIVNLIKEKKIPLKVTHNDTKLNNILFDEETKKSLCIIDLDTIMPGSALYDFGDSIRFGCNTASEDEKVLDKVDFNIEYFKAYTEAYLKAVSKSINKYELENLAFSAKLMTLECGIRFLDDYLDGNKYFATKYEEHNLVRCRTQFKLVKLMEEHMDELNKIVKKAYRSINE